MVYLRVVPPRDSSAEALTRRRFLASLPALGALPSWVACSSRRNEWGVAVVGSGPAGAVLACRLVERGIPTVLLEAGPAQAASDDPGDAAGYPVARTRVQAPGGTTNAWAGGCSRLSPRDFDPRNPYAPSPWPLTYGELEADYEAAESELMVRGGVTTPYTPPRRRPYAPARADAGAVSALVAGLARGGLVAEAPPLSSRAGEAGVRLADTHLPRFLSSPHATWRPGHRVTGLRAGRGGIEGLDVHSAGGTTTVRADAYVLAGGGIEAPRLLLSSHSPAAPRGLGNEQDLVGRGFSEHLVVDLGTVPLEGAPPGAEALSFQLYEAFKDAGLGGVVLEATVEPADTFRLSAVYEMKAQPANRVALDASRRDRWGLAEATVAIEPSEAEARTLARLRAEAARVLRQFGTPRLVGTPPDWCGHHMGTCRMGDDPRRSVVDRHLRVHGWRNLYVAGSAPFVTFGVGSPTLLIAALSVRLADHLAGELGAGR